MALLPSRLSNPLQLTVALQLFQGHAVQVAVNLLDVAEAPTVVPAGVDFSFS